MICWLARVYDHRVTFDIVGFITKSYLIKPPLLKMYKGVRKLLDVVTV